MNQNDFIKELSIKINELKCENEHHIGTPQIIFHINENFGRFNISHACCENFEETIVSFINDSFHVTFKN